MSASGRKRKLTDIRGDFTKSTVAPDAMYLTDDGNGAIFPLPSGEFPIGSMMAMGHYEVQGEPTPAAPPTPGPSPFRFSSPSASPTPVPFSFFGGPRTLPPRASGHFGKTFQRSINVGEVAGNRIVSTKTLVVRFAEAEANVEAILQKTREALGQEGDNFVLTDSQGNEIQDTDGTRTSQFWRQNSRKVFVLPEGEFDDLQQQRRAKVSRREDNTLLDRAEEVKVAAESLENVANAIKKLAEVATAHLQRPSLQPAKDAMACLVCKAVFVDPQFAACCGTLVGCKLCVEQWCASSDFCLKCRTANFAANLHAVRGLSPAAEFFKDFD